MSERIPKVAVVGSLHYDIMVRAPYLPRLGETLMGSQWFWKPGGKGGNQALAAARHGASVEMIGAVGNDDFGIGLRASLREAGVGLQHVSTVSSGSGMSVALVEGDGDYSAVVVSGANLTIDAARIEASAHVLRAARVLILQNEIAEVANIAAARIMRQAGGVVLLNAAPACPIPSQFGELLGVLVVNAIEAEMLGSGKVDDLDSAVGAAMHLSRIAPTAIVTAGGNGLAVASPGGIVALPAHTVAVAETHGAGDAFVGAFAARLADGELLEAALRYANAAAALHVSVAAAEQSAINSARVRGFLATQPQA